MRIKDVSEKTGLPDSTIRYYDSLGLLGPLKRSSNNYRLFDNNDVKILDFITESKELGFSLAEIEEILDIKNGGEEPCEYVANKIEEKVLLIDEHIQNLLAKKEELLAHLEAGEAVCGWKGNVCHYIEGFNEDSEDSCLNEEESLTSEEHSIM